MYTTCSVHSSVCIANKCLRLAIKLVECTTVGMSAASGLSYVLLDACTWHSVESRDVLADLLPGRAVAGRAAVAVSAVSIRGDRHRQRGYGTARQPR